MANGNDFFIGAVIGTGSDIDVELPGRKARVVEIINVDSGDQLRWTDTMPDAYGLKTIAAGTSSYLTTKGITPIAKGFTIGADTDVNVATETIHYVVWF